MDITEVRLKRRELEDRIGSYTWGLVQQFRKETGLSPSAIRIEMVDVTTIGATEREYVVRGCSTTIDI